MIESTNSTSQENKSSEKHIFQPILPLINGCSQTGPLELFDQAG
jgi:hypothetical protein